MSPRTLTIRLEGELFALPADRVEEVLPRAEITAMPGLPVHVPGVLRYRARWIPLVDAGPPLGLPAGPRAAALVLRRGRYHYALGVDAVAGISEGDHPDRDIITPLDPDTLFTAQLPAGEERNAMAEPEAGAAPVSAVVFRLGAHELGIDITQVHEVLTWRQPAPVPRAPAFVQGVVDLRGDVVPIIDMRERLGLEIVPCTGATRIVVVALGGERVGLVVDEVTEVSRLPQSSIARPPRYFRGLAAELIQGLARIDDRLVVLLHIDRILNSDEQLRLTETDLTASPPSAAGSRPPAPGRARAARKAAPEGPASPASRPVPDATPPPRSDGDGT